MSVMKISVNYIVKSGMKTFVFLLRTCFLMSSIVIHPTLARLWMRLMGTFLYVLARSILLDEFLAMCLKHVKNVGNFIRQKS